MTAVITPGKRSRLPVLVTAVLFCLLLGNAHASTGAQALHVLNRLAFGPRPGDVQRVAAMGVDAYIQQQLHPDSIPLPEELQQQLAALDTLQLTPTELFQQYGPPQRPRGQKLTPEQIKAFNQQSQMI